MAIELSQYRVERSSDGRERFVGAEAVKPGDVIEYRAVYTNRSNKAVAGLTADLPIPEGFEYLPKSATPGKELVTVATKDGNFAPEPLMRRLPGDKTEPVAYREYRSVRWRLGQLPAGGVTAVSARATLEVPAPASPKTVSTRP